MKYALSWFISALLVAGGLFLAAPTFAFQNLSTTGNGSPAATPSLQAVTNVGAVTTNQVTVANLISTSSVTSTFASSVSSTRYFAGANGTAALPAFALPNIGGSGGQSGMYAGANSILFSVNGVGPYLTLSGSANGLQAGVNITPSSNNTYSLGTAALSWSDIYASGTIRGVSQTLTGTSTAGPYQFTDDAGMVTGFDMSITSASVIGNNVGYDFSLDGSPFMSVLGVSDGAGSMKTTSTAVRFYQPIAASGIAPGYRVENNTSATATASDNFISVSTTNLAAQLYLPSATSTPVGFELYINDGTGFAATRNITVIPYGGNTINGFATLTISTNSSTVGIVNSGVTDWKIKSLYP